MNKIKKDNVIELHWNSHIVKIILIVLLVLLLQIPFIKCIWV